MSWQARVLNRWLRWTEKPFLTRAATPQAVRRSFDVKARLFFHAPRGTRRVPLTLAGLPALRVVPRAAVPGRTLLYFHGGAHVFGSPRAYASLATSVALRAGAVAILPRYPLTPEAVFPAAIDHCRATYRALLDQGQEPGQLILAGDSAGGNLALALLGQLIAEGAPLPACAFSFSPLTDLSFASPSMVDNERAEVVLPAHRVREMAAAYLDGHDPEDPRASPVRADFTGAPPVWLSVGDTEIVRDDTLRLAEVLRAAGVETEVELAHDLPHVWPLFHNTLPEARATLDRLGAWITAQTGTSAPTR